jgi:hypothetical protein
MFSKMPFTPRGIKAPFEAKKINLDALFEGQSQSFQMRIDDNADEYSDVRQSSSPFPTSHQSAARKLIQGGGKTNYIAFQRSYSGKARTSTCPIPSLGNRR